MPATILHTREWLPGRADAGAAAPVAVLVHGVTGWHRTWWRVGPALAERGWRAVAVDQRGHGASPRIDGHATIADWAADLGAVIEAIGPPVDAVIGHSLGAAVVVELAYRRADLVRRIVLEDPPAIGRADDVAWQANMEREIRAARATPDAEIERELAENPAWRPEDARQDVEGKQRADVEGLLASFRNDIRARVPDLAGRLSVPALYLLAAEDRSVYRGEARRRLAAELPAHSRLVALAGGHTLHRDVFDEYMATVLGWLTPGAGRG